MGTWNGLHRFDGKNIRVFKKIKNDTLSIQDNIFVSNFVEDHNDNLWFGSTRGIIKYERSTGLFFNYHLPDFHPSRHFVIGMDENENLWFDFEFWTHTFNLKTKSFDRKARVDLIKLNREMHLRSEMWNNNSEQITSIISYGSIRNDYGFHIKHFNNDTLVDQNVCFHRDDTLKVIPRDIHIQNDSILFVAAQSGFYKMNYRTYKIKKIELTEDGHMETFDALCTWGDDCFLIARADGFYLKYNHILNKVDNEFVLYFKNEKMIDQAFSMYSDKEGGIWINIPKKGIAYFNYKNVIFHHRRYYDESGHPFTVEGVYESSKGEIWLYSNKKGVMILDSNMTNVRYLNSESKNGLALPSNKIQQIVEDETGRIWLCTSDKKIIRLSGNSLQRMDVLESDLAILNLGVSKTGDILISKNKGGLYVCPAPCDQMDSFIYVNAVPDYLYTNFDICHNGLVWTQDNNWDLVSYDPQDNFKVISRIGFDSPYRDMHFIEGTKDILIASDDGLFYYHESIDSLESIDHTELNDGSTINLIVSLDPENYFLPTSDGILNFDLNDRKFTNYSIEHGIGSKVIQGVSYRDDSHRLLIGSTDGLALWNKSEQTDLVASEKVNIMSIWINEKPLELLEGNRRKNTSELKEVRLKHKSNTISFEFASLSYIGIDRCQYQYRLKELEQVWINCGNRGYARYAGLKPLDYSLEFRVKDEPKTVREIKISISPPIYGQSWFKGLAFVVFIGMLIFFIQLFYNRKRRVQQLKYKRDLALERERVRIATDMHDEIGSGLSALNMNVRLLENHVKDHEINQRLQLIAMRTSELTKKVREIIWTVNAQNDTLENLISTLHQFSKDFFEPTKTKHAIDVPDLVERPVSGKIRREVFFYF